MPEARRPWWVFAAVLPYLLHLVLLLDARLPGPGPAGWDLRYSAGRLRLAAVQPHSPAARAGLQPGDLLLAIDGVPAPRALGLEILRRSHRVDFLRDGARRHARIVVERRSWSAWLHAPKFTARVLPVLCAVLSFALGFLIVFGQPLSWISLGFAWPLLAAPAYAAASLAGLPEPAVLVAFAALFAAHAGAFPALLSALAAFPQPLRNRYALWLLWLPALALAPATTWFHWMALRTPAALDGAPFLYAISRALAALYLVAGLAILPDTYSRLGGDRRRVRALFAGLALVLLSYLAPAAISGVPMPDRSLLRLLQFAWALYPIEEIVLSLRAAGLLLMIWAVLRRRPFEAFAARPAPSLPRLRGWLLPAAQVAGLALTGWLVWYSSVLPRLRRSSLGDLLLEAFAYALLAWAWSAAIALCLYFAIPKPAGASRFPLALRVSMTAVWFAPATTLLSAFSPVSMAAALILVVSATRLLYFHWRLLWPEPVSPAVPRGFLLAAPGAISLRQLAPKLAASSTLQGGAVAILMRYPLAAAALLALSVALLTLLWELNVRGFANRPQDLPRSIMAVVLTIVLAAGLTVGGLAGYPGAGRQGWSLFARPRPGLWETARSLLDEMLGEGAPRPTQPVAARREPPAPEPADILDDSYPGVILWPEVLPHVTVVAPLPAFALTGAAPAVATRPFSIPFSGEYWIYTPPFSRPPQKSLVSRGSPVRLAYFTRDHRPMRMEARHRLDDPIALACCSAIRLEIRSADRYPGTVSLELILVNSAAPGEPALSLGRIPVTAYPDPRREPPVALPQLLEFPVPPSAALSAFDTFKLVFHRDASRGHRSARIAIDRFLLVPRGAG